MVRHDKAIFSSPCFSVKLKNSQTDRTMLVTQTLKGRIVYLRGVQSILRGSIDALRTF